MSIDYAEIGRLVKKGRRAEKRAKAVEGCITALITSLISGFLKGWLFMLAVGIMHDHWVPALPTIGFWWSVLLMFVLPSFGTAPSKTKDD
jgi:hypothetical protein